MTNFVAYYIQTKPFDEKRYLLQAVFRVDYASPYDEAREKLEEKIEALAAQMGADWYFVCSEECNFAAEEERDEDDE